MYCNILIFNIIFLVNLFSTDGYATCPAYENVQAQKSCRTSSVETARGYTFYQNSGAQDSSFTRLQQESLQKAEELKKDPAFQEIVAELQKNSSHPQNTEVNFGAETQVNLSDGNLNEAELYIFVSFSLGGKALLNLAHEAKRFGATLVLRGFREGSYLNTAQALQKIILKTSQGIIIDPELYSLFNITAVPMFVLAKPFALNTAERTQTPIHDKLQGHVSTHYALETFAKRGDLKEEAHELLSRGAIK